jgi:thiamine biosynthesis lipoprotein
VKGHLAAAAVLCCAALAGAAAEELVQRDAYLMGTRVRLVTWAATRSSGLARLDRALEALETTEAELSTWRDDSAIAALNRSAPDATWKATGQLCDTFRTVAEWNKRTAGTFDPAIGRLIDVWDIHGAGRIPSDAEVERALTVSGFRLLEFDPVRCVVVRRDDVTIDVGAFGKGDGLDRAARVLGDAPWMIDLGGQVSVHSAPPGQNGWVVSIAHPLERSRPTISLRIRDGSLSTSGGSERDLMVAGQRVSHHLDPRTGRPASFRGSVSVWHPRALAADILSTALFVMGPEEGLRWAEAQGISACYLIPDAADQVRVVATTAFRALITS